MLASGTLRGSESPRLSTPPARKLTKRATLGHAAIRFAEDVLGFDLLPWQRWWLLHALELDSNGDFRFRVIVTCVARQSGKTTLLVILALFMMYLGHARLVLGSAQSLDIAREAWTSAVDAAQADTELAEEVESVRYANGEQCLTLTNGARYRIAASTRSAGRGLSVDLLILDELREHRDWAAWSALSKTTMARPCSLTVAISNAGDDESVVLNSLRERALSGQDPTVALFEWSAEEGCALDDPKAWVAANPGLGYTISEAAIRTALATDPPAVFRTEVLCQKVDQLDGAYNAAAWKSCRDAEGSLAGVRDRVVAAVDVAPDGGHATLMLGALLDDGRARVEVASAWQDTASARAELLDLLVAIKPQAIGWFPGGPASAIADVLRLAAKQLGVPLVEIKGTEVAQACMTFGDLINARRILQPGDPLLDAHIAGASKLLQGDGWRLVRRGAGHVDAAYSAAGVVHVALTLPESKPAPMPFIV